jgi:hypothetical protein
MRIIEDVRMKINKTSLFFLTLFVFGCSNPQKPSSNPASLPPVTNITPEQTYVKGSVQFDLTSTPQSSQLSQLKTVSRSQSNCTHGQCVDFSNLTVNNSGLTEFSLIQSQSQQTFPFTTQNANLGVILTLQVGQLFDNNLNSCGGQKCDLALIRIYTTNAAQPGLYNSLTQQAIPLTVTGPNDPTPANIGLNIPNATIIQEQAIPAIQQVINLATGDFSNSNYQLNADFTQAGAGTYTAHVVVEYVLASTNPPTLAITSPDVDTETTSGLTVSGSCESDINSVTLSGDIQSAPLMSSCSNGQFSQAVIFTSGDGFKNVTVSQTNSLGTVGSVTREFIEKNTPPQIIVGNPAPTTNGSGGVDSNNMVYVNNQGSVSYSITFDDSVSGSQMNQIRQQSVSRNSLGSGENRSTVKVPVINITPAQIKLITTGTATCSNISIASPVGSTTTITLANCTGDGTVAFDILANAATNQSGLSTLEWGPSPIFAVKNTAPLLTQVNISSPLTTDGNSITFGGACEVGELVLITGADSTAATCNSNVWTYTSLAQSNDGTYNYNFTQTDLAGNASIVTAQWIRNTVPPTLASVMITNNNPTNSLTYHLSYGAEVDTSSNITSYCILENNTNVASCVWQNGILPSSYTVSSTNNAKVLTVFLKNALGTISSAISSNAITLDTVIPSTPSVTLSAPASSPNNLKTPTVAISNVINGDTIGLYSDSACSIKLQSNVASSSSDSFTLASLADGTYKFYSNQTDLAGNISPCSTTFASYVLKTSAPTVAITSPTSSFYVNAANMAAFSANGSCANVGSSPANLSLSITGISGSPVTSTSTCSATWSVSNLNLSSLPDGALTLTVHETDSAGNVATPVSVSFNKLTTIPTVTILSPIASSSANATNSAIFPANGTCSANGQALSIKVGSVSASPICATNAWSTTLNLSAISDGQLSMTADLTDVAGNNATEASVSFSKFTATLAYSGSPYVFTKGTAITAINPAITGSITSCTISPALPTGLLLANSSCIISGTPSVISSAASYTITSSNTGGSTTAIINITVNDAAPSITYLPLIYVETKGTAISAINPINNGGPIVSCALSPATLPIGLSFSSTTCAITGNPTSLLATTIYTVTATNTGGNSAFSFNLTVNDAIPSSLVYSGSPYTFTKGTAITSVTPTSSGGAITGCSAVPTLPSGLSLATNCQLSGNPTLISSQASYVITATNTGGSTTATISVTVNDVIPSSLVYTGSPYSFTNGTTISTLTPTISGGTLTNCSSSPTLPTGLSLSTLNCAISGTPSVIAAAANYIITATNSGGSTTATINLAVNASFSLAVGSGNNQSIARGVTSKAIIFQLVNSVGTAITTSGVSISVTSSGAGTLNPATAQTTNAAGNVTVTYTAPSSLETAILTGTAISSSATATISVVSFAPSSVTLTANSPLVYTTTALNPAAESASPVTLTLSAPSPVTTNTIAANTSNPVTATTKSISTNTISGTQTPGNAMGTDTISLTGSAALLSSSYTASVTSPSGTIAASNQSWSPAYSGSNVNYSQSIARNNLTTGNVIAKVTSILANVAGSFDYTNSPTLSSSKSETNQVSNIYSTGSDNPSNLTPYNGALYGSMANPTNGNPNLFRYCDGSAASATGNGCVSGTSSLTQLSNNNPSFGDSPNYLTVYNGALYMELNDSSGLTRLFRYCDGSSASNSGSASGNGCGATESLTQLSNVGTGSDAPLYLTVYNGALYFQLGPNNGFTKLYRYCDGSAASAIGNGCVSGTNSVTQISNTYPSGYDGPTNLVAANGALYMNLTVTGGYTHLFKYCDGSAASFAGSLAGNGCGTSASLTQISNILPTGQDAPEYLAAYNGALYMAMVDASDLYRLYRYCDGSTGSASGNDCVSGTPSLTVLTDGYSNGAAPIYLTVYNNSLYFGGQNSNWDYLAQYCDGSSASAVGNGCVAGTQVFNQISNSDGTVVYLTVYNNALFMNFTPSTSNFSKLFMYCDGSPASMTGTGCVSGNQSITQLSNYYSYQHTGGHPSHLIFASDSPMSFAVSNGNLYMNMTNASGFTKMFRYPQ